MKHKPCFLFFAIFCFSFVVFSQPHNEQFLIAEAVTEVQKSSASVTIHSNVRNASVYLNGQYYGTTPCTVTDLAPGTYRLRITKQGYNSVSHYISVSRKQNSSFYVELERLVGFIRLHGVPENASVYCDDTLISSYGVTGTIELPEGYHTITVRKFGYADFVTSLYVTRRLITPLHVSMRSETFSLSNFSASKKQINPAYTNSLGTCNFSFTVTAPESANLSITDENGIVVYSYNFPTFTTWEQKVAWNGRSVTGEVLPDGVYCATLSAGDYTEKVYVQINSALRYHVADISFSGSSIGNLPAPFTQGEKTFFLGLGVSPAFIVQKDAPFYGIPINFFFGFNPVSWFEFSSSLTLNTGNMGGDGTNVTVPVMMNVSAKFSTQIPLQTGGQFSVGGVVRYGGTLNGSLKHSDGKADTGNGFALGLAVGVDGEKVFGGLSSEFICGAGRGDVTDGHNIWKNGLALEVRPVTRVSLKAWGALNSSLKKDEMKWASAVDTGLSSSFLLGDSTAVLFLRGNALFFINGQNYIFTTIGLSYIF